MKIIASDRLADLKGIGTEFWMTKDGQYVRLEFFNGKIVNKACGNVDDTITSNTEA